MTTMQIDRAVVEQALEALKNNAGEMRVEGAISILETALAQQDELQGCATEEECTYQPWCRIRGTCQRKQADPDISRCPRCGGAADNGHDRELPPNPYFCSRCMAQQTELVEEQVMTPITQRNTLLKAFRELMWIRQFIHKNDAKPGVVIRDASGEEIAVWIDRVDAIIETLKEEKSALLQQAEHFCDTHCTWADHAAGCVMAEPAQEPVAWIYQNMYTEQEYLVWKKGTGGRNWRPLYAAPPQRKLVPLTEAEIGRIGMKHVTLREVIRAAERAHGIKE